MESSPSPAYGAVLEWQLGSNALGGSNPPDSAHHLLAPTGSVTEVCIRYGPAQVHAGEADQRHMTTLSRTPLTPVGASRLNVLLVEDDPATAALTAALLDEAAGAVEVDRADSLASALVLLSEKPHDCVLLDVQLPDSVGDHAVHQIHRIAPGLPIVLLSGMASGELQRLAIQSGAQVSLSKDELDAEILWDGIGAALERELSESTTRHNARLARLLQIASRTADLTTRVEAVLTDMRTSLGMDLGMVCRIDDSDPDGGATNTIEFISSERSAIEAGMSAPLDATYCSMPWATNTPVAIEHMATVAPDRLCYRTIGAESYIGVPLVVDGDRYGTINFISPTVAIRRFGRLDVDYVSVAANLVSGWLQEHQREALLEESRERFRLAFDNAPIGMVVGGLDGTLVQVNRAFADSMGVAPADLRGTAIEELTHPEDRAASRSFLQDLLDGLPVETIEKRYVRPDGRVWWGQVHTSLLRDADGNPQSFVTQIQDTTERRAAQRRLADMALHDSLTGLPNRALLQDRLTKDLATGTREGTTTAALFLDLDRFKHVNDTHGHAAGDQLLKVLAGRLDQIVRPNDTVARLGGDEFVVVCTDLTDRADLDTVISRITEVIEQRVVLDGTAVTVGVSIGVAFADAGTPATAESLLRDADAAMYRAKGRGRARAEVFTEALRDDAVRHEAITRDLHDAIMSASLTGEHDTDGLSLVYQPLLSTVDDRPCGVETLIRWQHPTLGWLSPDDFLSVAEETGLIVPMGRWVLSRALRDWAGVDLSVSVNHAVAEIAAPDFVPFVQQQLDATGVPPERLCIEVTESSVLEEHGSAMAALRRLREMGVRLAIDDFGAGYTSLAHLTDSPFTELKIDRSFITNADEAQWSIVEAIVRVCDTLGLHSVIEGVEDLESLERARRVGCDASQGYVHSRPVPLAQARTIVLA